MRITQGNQKSNIKNKKKKTKRKQTTNGDDL